MLKDATRLRPKLNLAYWDRTLRVLAGIGLLVTAISLPTTRMTAVVLAFLGGILLLTGVDGY